MTESQQRRFYFPNWNSCAVANEWLMRRDRLVADLAAQREDCATWPDPARELYFKVVATADQLALQQHRAVTAEDLRHGCNFVISGKVSSADMDNRQTNRVVTLFKLLADPDDLDAVMNWLNPEKQEKESFIAFLLKRANEALIITIAENAYGTKFWRDLPIQNLRWLAKQLKDRRPNRRRFFREQLARIEQRHSSGREYDPANAVF